MDPQPELELEPARGSRARELRFQQALFINGEWRSAATAATFTVEDPSTGETIATLPRAGAEETIAAIDAAHAIFADWKRVPVLQRADLLLKVAQLIHQYREPLAQLAVLEQGQPLEASRLGIDYAASFFRWFGEETRRIYGRTIPHPDPRRRVSVEYTPRGVAGLITPWNAPLASPAKKVAAALAAGCPVVLKPAELTPLSALALAWLIQQAGFPPGVFNVIFGDAPAIGTQFVEHPAVRTISFTGSLAVGRKIYSAAAEQMKHVALELGGNAPFIIFADADLEQATSDLLSLKAANSGQICVTANRLLVHHSIAGDVERRLVETYGALRVGDGFSANVEQGPLISRQAVDRVEGLVRGSQQAGSRVLCGGRRLELGPNFYPPTIVSEIPAHARLLREEIFGPVLPIQSFSEPEEALALANETRHRLSAFAYTQSLELATRCARELDFGVVGVNDPRPISCETPFGGVAESGIGREGGSEGLLDFMEARLVAFRS